MIVCIEVGEYKYLNILYNFSFIMSEKPLYQDDKLKIDFFENSIDDHVLYIKDKSGKEFQFIIQRDILQELAKTPRGGIESKIYAFDELILVRMGQAEIGIDGLHVALCQAYAEQEYRYFHSK